MTTSLTTNDFVRNASTSGTILALDPVEFAAANLPALTGSPKQIEWAGKIRTQCLRALGELTTNQMRAAYRRHHSSESYLVDAAEADQWRARVADVAGKLAAALDGRTSAAWWIDNRNELTCDVRCVARLTAA